MMTSQATEPALEGNHQEGPARLRLTFLAVFPSPYMLDLFDAIHQDQRIQLRVHYLERPARAAPGIYWRERPLPLYSSAMAGDYSWPSGARIRENTALLQALRAERPDLVVVLGYSSFTHQLAMYYLSAMRIPWVFWGELPGMERRGPMGSLLRWLALRPVAHFASGVAAIGSRAAGVYRQITRRNQPVWSMPYYCRIDTFSRSKRLEPGDSCNDFEGAREAADRSLVKGASAAPHYLFCGQLVHRKGVDLLVRSFCRLAQNHHDIRLTLVGDGPLRAPLAASVPEAIRDRVTWAGFQEIEDLPRHFAGSNVFVLPSRHDGWGVVINQAIGAGMAVVASDAVGAAVDLVSDGVNGFVFPNGNEGALLSALRFFIEHPEVISKFCQASRAKAHTLSPREGAERWRQFSEMILHIRNGARSVKYHDLGA